MTLNRTAQLVTAVYFAPVLLSFLPLFFANDPLAGIFAITLTQLWSTLSVTALDAINPALLDAGVGILTTLLGGVINAALLYGFVRWLGRFRWALP